MFRENIWLCVMSDRRGHVERSEHDHSADINRLRRSGRFAVSAAFGRQIDNHGSRRHPREHISCNEDSARLPGTAAVVITTSLSATTLAMAACWRL